MSLQPFQQNPFNRSFTAKYDNGRGSGLSCKYNLHRGQRPAHVVYCVQTSQSKVRMESAQRDLTTIYNSLSAGDDLTLVAFDSSFNVWSNIDVSKVPLGRILRYVDRTSEFKACLWKALTKGCSLLRSRAARIKDDNCFLIFKVAGDDDCGGSMHVFETAFGDTSAQLPYFYPASSHEAGSSLDSICTGETVSLEEHVRAPGSYYEGNLHLEAFGTGHKPSEVMAASRHRRQHEVADQFLATLPSFVKEIRADHMLGPAMNNMRIGYK